MELLQWYGRWDVRYLTSSVHHQKVDMKPLGFKTILKHRYSHRQVFNRLSSENWRKTWSSEVRASHSHWRSEELLLPFKVGMFVLKTHPGYLKVTLVFHSRSAIYNNIFLDSKKKIKTSLNNFTSNRESVNSLCWVSTGFAQNLPGWCELQPP